MKTVEPLAFDEVKFCELVLYVAQRCMGDPEFGATKMAKALWHVDFQAFARFGRPITGADYQKLDFGPAPRQFLPMLNRLKAQGFAQEAEQEVNGFHSKRVVALRPSNVACFSSEEIMLVEGVLESIRTKSASQLSRESHDFQGWKLTSIGESIPYATQMLPDAPIPPEAMDFDYAQGIARRLNGEG